MRTRAERRHNDWTKAIRKRNILKDMMWHDGEELYDNLHQYSKNKVHCSCFYCSNVGGQQQAVSNDPSHAVQTAQQAPAPQDDSQLPF